MVAMQAVKMISVETFCCTATGTPVPEATSPITDFCFQEVLLNLHFTACIVDHLQNPKGLSAQQRL